MLKALEGLEKYVLLYYDVATDAERLAHLVVPTGQGAQATKIAKQAIKDYLHDLPTKPKLKVEEGIPGKLGKTLKFLQYGAVGASSYSFVKNVRNAEYVDAGIDAIDVVSVVGRGTVGHAATAFTAGYAAGTVVNNRLSEETRETIGDTVYSIVMEGGWREIYRHPFGIGM